jgi:predicted ATP-grasp superfamily ATP-dependent carboligase
MPRPAIVALADNTIALNVIRSLGRNGVPVIAVTTKTGVAHFSRYCSEVVVTSRVDFEQAVLDLVRARHRAYLICLGEIEIQALNRLRGELAEYATLLFPAEEQFSLALNKDCTLALAEMVRVPIPRTIKLVDDPDLSQCRTLGYPAVLKPRHQDVVDFKVDYANSFEELEEKILRHRDHRDFLLVQEYIAGVGVGVEMLMRSGRVLAAFQHRRVREDPPSGGVSVCCESEVLNPELFAHSANLLRRMNWEGVAMVEYRMDRVIGKFALMEVNGRFWGSLPLAIHCGVEFPYALVRSYSEEGALPVPDYPVTNYRCGVRCRLLVGDTKWLLAVLRDRSIAPARALMAYLFDFAPAVRYYIWAWDDQKPAYAAPVRRMWRVVRKLMQIGR